MTAPLYLVTGLQGSGTTLVSWCFLQREDMDGVLDAPYHRLPDLPTLDGDHLRFYKQTIACFRATEIIDYFEDFGRPVRPLLVVRDVRAVWNSLGAKHYGWNGTTSRHPPLRLRFRRFLEDWRFFVDRGFPILSYESMVRQPESTLRKACNDLGLSWTQAMHTWPKAPEAVLDPFWGNATFHRNKGADLESSLHQAPLEEPLSEVYAGDLHWLETTFAEFLTAHGYRETLPAGRPAPQGWSIPRFDNSGHHCALAPYYFVKKLLVRSERVRRLAIRIQSHPRFPRRGARKL
jgi:hypothetical protein